MRLAALALFVPGLAAATPSGAKCLPGPGTPVDLAALAKQSKTIDIAEDDLRTALAIKDNPIFAPALALGDGAAAIAWADCNQAVCRGSLARLSGAPAAPKLGKRVALVAPSKVFAVDGFQFTDAALADLDGDGTAELVLHYTAVEPPRKALGSLVHEYVAVYAPKDLTLLFSHELRRAGADTEDACQWTLGQSNEYLVVTGQCNVRSCLETPAATCKPNRTSSETWRRAGARPYVKAAR